MSVNRIVEKVEAARYNYQFDRDNNQMNITVFNGNGNWIELVFANTDALNHFSKVVYRGSIAYEKYNGIERVEKKNNE